MVFTITDTDSMSLKGEALYNKLTIALMLHQKALAENRNIDVINRLSTRIGRLIYILEHRKAA